GMEVELPSNKIDTLRKMEDIKAVHKNKIVHANLDTSVPLIRAPETWEEEDEDGLQVTGKGVTVGVVGTGIDYTHPDLGNGIGKDYKVLGGYNYIDDSSDPMDDHGHGTHVAGIVAADGEVTGVAPDASLVAYKVLDNQGKGEISGILEALEDIASPDNEYGIDVINMSLGVAGDENSPLSAAASAVVQTGISVVVSAGNDGPGGQTITAPGSAEDVITVGAST